MFRELYPKHAKASLCFHVGQLQYPTYTVSIISLRVRHFIMYGSLFFFRLSHVC